MVKVVSLVASEMVRCILLTKRLVVHIIESMRGGSVRQWSQIKANRSVTDRKLTSTRPGRPLRIQAIKSTGRGCLLPAASRGLR